MSDHVPKCTFSDNSVTPCTLLTRATEYGNPRGKQKGLWEWRLYKIDFSANTVEEEKPSSVRFGAKSGEFVDKGIAFNFCPFCGERIDGHESDAKEECRK